MILFLNYTQGESGGADNRPHAKTSSGRLLVLLVQSSSPENRA